MSLRTGVFALLVVAQATMTEVGAQVTVGSTAPDTLTVPAAALRIESNVGSVMHPAVRRWVSEQASAAVGTRWEPSAVDAVVRRAIPVRFSGQPVRTDAADALAMLVLIELIRAENAAILAIREARTGESEEQARLRENEARQSQVSRYLATATEKLAQMRRDVFVDLQ